MARWSHTQVPVTPAILVSEIERGWGAGFGGDEIGLFIGSWSDSQIVINGFGGSTTGDSTGQPLVGPDPAKFDFPILPGNSIYIDIVGPGCTSTYGGWPQEGTTPNPPNALSGWPVSCSVQYGPIYVSSAFVTPVFPLGSILALLVPLAALLAYFVVERKGPAKYPNLALKLDPKNSIYSQFRRVR